MICATNHQSIRIDYEGGLEVIVSLHWHVEARARINISANKNDERERETRSRRGITSNLTLGLFALVIYRYFMLRSHILSQTYNEPPACQQRLLSFHTLCWINYLAYWMNVTFLWDRLYFKTLMFIQLGMYTMNCGLKKKNVDEKV